MIVFNIFVFFLTLFYTQANSAFQYKNFDQSIKDIHNLSGMSFGLGMPKFVIDMYLKNVHILQEQQMRHPNKIPKIIHFIWIGGDMPPYLNFCIESWRRLHPAWKIIMWDDQSVKKLVLINRALYDGMTNVGCKADILRLEILKQFGGVYVDTDFFCLKPIDILMNLEYFHSTESNHDTIINNGIIGCVPNHYFINDMISEVSKISIENSNHNDVLNLAGPLFITKFFTQKHEAMPSYFVGDIIIFPPSYFCPFPNHLVLRNKFWMGELTLEMLIKKYTFPESFAVHLWNSSWFISRRRRIYDILEAKKIIFTESGSIKDVLNARNINGLTPLMVATINNWQPEVEELLKNGANPALIDFDGISTIDYAKKRGLSHLFEPYSNENIQKER